MYPCPHAGRALAFFLSKKSKQESQEKNILSARDATITPIFFSARPRSVKWKFFLQMLFSLWNSVSSQWFLVKQTCILLEALHRVAHGLNCNYWYPFTLLRLNILVRYESIKYSWFLIMFNHSFLILEKNNPKWIIIA